jgi:hypothetical protein
MEHRTLGMIVVALGNRYTLHGPRLFGKSMMPERSL